MLRADRGALNGSQPMNKQALHPWAGPVMLVLLIGGGMVAQWTGLIDAPAWLLWARAHADHWWLPVALVALQAGLFTFGLPGSVLVWVFALLYEPWAGTGLFAFGALIGALGAYLFVRRVGGPWAEHYRETRVFRWLRASDWMTLLAVRTLPTFPHSVINFSAGLLVIPLGRFLSASAIGLVVKGYVYVSAIHHAAEAGVAGEGVTWQAGVPLALLAGLFLLAAWLRRWWGRTRQ